LPVISAGLKTPAFGYQGLYPLLWIYIPKSIIGAMLFSINENNKNGGCKREKGRSHHKPIVAR
jgi:hypothetical protein